MMRHRLAHAREAGAITGKITIANDGTSARRIIAICVAFEDCECNIN
jgi:hypothetical protein